MNEFLPAGRVLPLPEFHWHIVISGNELLCAGDGLLHADISVAGPEIAASHYLGDLGGKACGVHHLPRQIALPGCEWRGLRSLLGIVSESEFGLASRAMQVINWDRDHRYCGRCGAQTAYHPRDRARTCQRCDFAVYPRISPCVIMLVTRGDECLLAQHSHHRRQLLTALAGFIEPGENAEQALVREVKEEVGLEVGAVRYIGSQSWPFPGQLMIGFLAEVSGGELRPDRSEISAAHWYHRDRLPQDIPPAQTLSGQLIRTFARQQAADQ
ncbi:NAD(+) diphosphatase [uncultured Microbulbifer sp.]|uniref:NAD(+) diphosphatase n=1 Tax=uncultured Microbulbifer sp. TaxID=348147 RepID=UPI0025F145B7|nr:NAD(+) diphosphatase [uncultured Microbulbifer sp.]